MTTSTSTNTSRSRRRRFSKAKQPEDEVQQASREAHRGQPEHSIEDDSLRRQIGPGHQSGSEREGGWNSESHSIWHRTGSQHYSTTHQIRVEGRARRLDKVRVDPVCEHRRSESAPRCQTGSEQRRRHIPPTADMTRSETSGEAYRRIISMLLPRKSSTTLVRKFRSSARVIQVSIHGGSRSEASSPTHGRSALFPRSSSRASPLRAPSIPALPAATTPRRPPASSGSPPRPES